MIKVLFVVDNIVYGGVSNALCETLKRINFDLYEVDLLILHKNGEMLSSVPQQVNVIFGTPFFEIIDQKIEVLWNNKNLYGILLKIRMALLLKSGLINAVLKHKRKKILKKIYNCEVAYKDGFCTIFSACSDVKLKIAWIHNDYSIFTGSKRYGLVLGRAFKKMSKIVSVSKTASRSAKTKFNLVNLPEVILNPFDFQAVIQMSIEFDPEFDSNIFNFVSVGRLDYAKGFDRLVRIHAKLINEGFYHHIFIIGSGENENKLRKLVNDLGVVSSFRLIGYRKNPYPYILKADCIVMSSRYEGSPIVIFEAMMLNSPIISTDVADVKDHLDHYRGMVVENEDLALYTGMRYILENQSQLNEYREHLKNFTYDNFEIMGKIAKLFEVENG